MIRPRQTQDRGRPRIGVSIADRLKRHLVNRRTNRGLERQRRQRGGGRAVTRLPVDRAIVGLEEGRTPWQPYPPPPRHPIGSSKKMTVFVYLGPRAFTLRIQISKRVITFPSR